VFAAPVWFRGVTLTAGADTATVILYDNATTNAGSVLAKLSATANISVSVMFPVAVRALAGIYALITGTSPSITVITQ